MAVSGSTQVITDAGWKNASTVGLTPSSYDLLNIDDTTGAFTWGNINSSTTQLLGSSITINFVSGNSLTCSPTQSVYKVGVGLVAANTLVTLDNIVGIEKNEIVINYTTNLLSLTVYKFVIATPNNYFANGVLVSD